MAHKRGQIVGLDVGSYKTCAVVCQRAKNERLEVAGFGQSESKGWRKGVIVNLDLAVLAIKKAVEAAEAAAGVPIDSAYVGVAGPHVQGINSKGLVTLGKAGGVAKEVTREDIRRVIQSAQSATLPSDRELLHVFPGEFLLDSQNGIRDPLGMIGKRLEASVHLVTASITAAQNVVTAANRAGIVVLDTVFEPLASAEVSLTPDERELGVALIDIGAGSADLIVYHQGVVRHAATIQVGGEHFTNDIAVGLRTPIPAAEKVKRTWSEHDPEKSSGVVLEVPGVGERPAQMVNYQTLSDIIEPRATELVELLQAALRRSGEANQLGAGVVLVGGGAKLGGFSRLTEQILELPVRVGHASGLAKMGEYLSDPEFSTAVGLVAHGNRLHFLRDTAEKGLAARIWNFLRGSGSPA